MVHKILYFARSISPVLLVLSVHAYSADTSQALPVPAPIPTTKPNVPTKSNVESIANESKTNSGKEPLVINCGYHISASQKVDSSIVSRWAEQAALKAFDLNYVDVDSQLNALQTCFTAQGWQGFNDALLQSGNIKAIKARSLTVSCQTNGDLKITSSKENQWKITIPLQVVYQNDKEKLTQELNIDLLIGRKITGDLGIMQMIAIPKNKTSEQTEQTPVHAQTRTPP